MNCSGKTPSVSVITTCYNGQDHLYKAVNSILSQKYNNFNLIVVDDGSTDLSTAILRDIKDGRVLVFLENHMGRQKALNYAISKSNSKYIAILDADDVAQPNRIAIQVNFLEKNPDVGLVSGGKRVAINSKGEIVNTGEAKAFSDKKIRETLKYTNPLFHSSVMYRREIYDLVGGYDESLFCLEDWDFYVRIARHCNLVNLPECFSYKRKHNDQFFDGERDAHRSKAGSRARAKIFFRTVFYLNAKPVNLLLAIKYLIKSILP